MKRINEISFELMEGPGTGWFQVTSNKVFDEDGLPAKGGVLDTHMGGVFGLRCETCKEHDCTGHFGYISLPHKEDDYLINPLFKTTMTFLPVIPLPSRKISVMDGKIALDDLSLTYITVMNILAKFSKLPPEELPWIIWQDYKDTLQFYVNILFENKIGYKKKGSGTPYTGILDSLKGKHGLIRSTCLGKRCTSMARSVFTVSPNLKIGQIGIPESFSKVLYTQDLFSDELAINEDCIEIIDKATGMRYNPEFFVKLKDPEHYYIIRGLRDGDWVMMNRAPSLHKYSILAFKAILMPGKTIKLNPMCCAPFNADCDGDAVNVIVPQSDEAKWECEHLINAERNIKSVRHGKNLIGPNQDLKVAAYLMGQGEMNTVEELDEFMPRAIQTLRDESLTFSKDHMLLITTRADARGSVEQFKQMWERGLEHDITKVPKNITVTTEPRESYRKGLSVGHFWEASSEGRMSMVHRSISPSGTGYMERKLVFCCGDLQWDGEKVVDACDRIISYEDFSEMHTGAYVGIMCAQSFGELSTQTVLRSFHRPGEVNVNAFNVLEKFLLRYTELDKDDYIREFDEFLIDVDINIDRRWVRLIADIKYIDGVEHSLNWSYIKQYKPPLQSMGFERVKQNLQDVIGRVDNLKSPFSQVIVGSYSVPYNKQEIELAHGIQKE